MRILFLAPQPFYQERGTPIAVKALLEMFSQRGDDVDVLTYHIGENVSLDNISIHRTAKIPFIRTLRPGFSFKKLVCDAFLCLKALGFARTGKYQLVYAVEEAVYAALLLKIIFRLPYIYDMDSSLSRQLVDQFSLLRFCSPLLRRLEGVAINHAAAVAPVCDALVNVAQRHRARHVTPIYDVPNLTETSADGIDDLRQQLAIAGKVLMYVGNLEPYQGIDLLLDSFALAVKNFDSLHLIIIGGIPQDVEKYRAKAGRLGLEKSVHLLGPKPVQQLSGYLAQADVLVSPRIKGDNTPMKIYSYLASGKPILATDLWTHRQVLDEQVSMLISPTAVCLAEGMLRLVESPQLGAKLSAAGKQLVETRYSHAAFSQRVTSLMDYAAALVER